MGMDFNPDRDINVFDPVFKKRPEIDLAKFKLDLQKFYLPYVQKLVDLKNSKSDGKGILVGISAIQGTGKTTQGEILEILLKKMGHVSLSLSIDDHYITHAQLVELRKADPRFIRRGVTHDLSLAQEEIKTLKEMKKGDLVLVAGYDKGAHHGDGDRFGWIIPENGLTVTAETRKESLMVDQETKEALGLHLTSAIYQGRPISLPQNFGSDIPLEEHFLPDELLVFLKNPANSALTIAFRDDGKVCFSGETKIVVEPKVLPKGWRLEEKKADFIFYDGWFQGARSVADESVFDQNLPALETPEAKQFAKDVNKKLKDYEAIWSMIDFLNVLYVPHYELSVAWRENAEKPLREKGEGMTSEQIVEFVHYFWRSVHPAIHIKNLAHDKEHTNQVAIIGDDHSIVEVLTPEEALQKYP